MSPRRKELWRFPGDPHDRFGFPVLVADYCEWMGAHGYSPRTIENRQRTLCCTLRRVALPSRLMTVPGKGGRPRKWRSDADRVRAYRARQTGIDEPSTLVQTLDDGDELARVWAMVRELGEQLDDANTTLKQVRRERDQTRRELEREQQRWGWIEARNTELEVERGRLETERDLTDDNAALHEQLARLEHAVAAPAVENLPAAPQRPLSRAERRRLEREQQRRRNT